MLGDITVRPYISLQHDWNHDLKQKTKGSFWVSSTDGNGKTVDGTIQVNFSGGSHRLSCDEDFQIVNYDESKNHRWIDISHGGISARFYVPLFQVNFHASQVNSLDISPAGELGVSGGDSGSLVLWDTLKGSFLRQMKGHVGDILTTRFFPSGQVILSGGSDTLIKVWDVDGECAATMKGHAGGVLATAIVDRGRNIVSCSRDGTAKLWEVGSQTIIQNLIKAESAVNCCSILKHDSGSESSRTPDSRESGTSDKLLVAGLENGKLMSVDLKSQSQLFYSALTGSAFNALSFGEDLKVFAGSEDGALSYWDLRNPSEPLSVFRRSSSAIRSISQGYSKGTFWVGSADGCCYEWDANNSNSTKELSGPDFEPIQAVYCRGNEVFTGSRDHYTRKYFVE